MWIKVDGAVCGVCCVCVLVCCGWSCVCALCWGWSCVWGVLCVCLYVVDGAVCVLYVGGGAVCGVCCVCACMLWMELCVCALCWGWSCVWDVLCVCLYVVDGAVCGVVCDGAVWYGCVLFGLSCSSPILFVVSLQVDWRMQLCLRVSTLSSGYCQEGCTHSYTPPFDLLFSEQIDLSRGVLPGLGIPPNGVFMGIPSGSCEVLSG